MFRSISTCGILRILYILTATSALVFTLRSESFQAITHPARETNVNAIIKEPAEHRGRLLHVATYQAYYPMTLYSFADRIDEDPRLDMTPGSRVLNHVVFPMLASGTDLRKQTHWEQQMRNEQWEYVLRGVSEDNALLVYSDRFAQLGDIPDEARPETNFVGYLDNPPLTSDEIDYLKFTYPDTNMAAVLYLREGRWIYLPAIIGIFVFTVALVPLLWSLGRLGLSRMRKLKRARV
ncbi:MAG: hypothetical protein KDK34_25020 [Leptospiraceae bacterium]|nr:hypothetical protein [Leptospiraceae bacterium]